MDFRDDDEDENSGYSWFVNKVPKIAMWVLRSRAKVPCSFATQECESTTFLCKWIYTMILYERIAGRRSACGRIHSFDGNAVNKKVPNFAMWM